MTVISKGLLELREIQRELSPSSAVSLNSTENFISACCFFACNFIVFYQFELQQTGVSKKKLWQTHCTLHAQHQTTDRLSQKPAGEHSGATDSWVFSCVDQNNARKMKIEQKKKLQISLQKASYSGVLFMWFISFDEAHNQFFSHYQKTEVYARTQFYLLQNNFHT